MRTSTQVSLNMASQSSQLHSIAPLFIVSNLSDSVEFYQSKLGFGVVVQLPLEQPFFAIVKRDSVSILLKEISPDVGPVPNHTQHDWARWDALVMCEDPDSLYKEFRALDNEFHQDLQDTEEQLRAFEIKDRYGYVLCFARTL